MSHQDHASYYSGQSYPQQSATSNPYATSAAYYQQYNQTSSGSEHGSCEADTTTDESAQGSDRRRRGGSASAPGNSPSSTSARRREQNRLAQRALRQRRESHIRHLEDRILHTSLETRHLASENRDLSQQLQQMALENQTLRQSGLEDTGAAAAAVSARAGANPAYQHYAQHGQYGNNPQTMAVGYGGLATPYQQSPVSTVSTPSSTGDPSPSNATWPYDAYAAQAQFDPTYWAAQQGHAVAYGQQCAQWQEDADDGEDDDDDEELENQYHQVPQYAGRRK